MRERLCGLWPEARRRAGALARALRCAGWLFVYHTRLLFTRQTVFLLVGVSILLAVVTVRAAVSSAAGCLRALQAFETGVFILLSMGLATRDREKGTFEMTLVSARSLHQLILLKFLPAAFWSLTLGLAAGIALDWLVGGFPLARALFFAYTTGLLAGVATLCLSVFLRNGYAAAGAILAAAFAIYAHYSGQGRQAILDPFLQLFAETPQRPTIGLLLWNRFYTLSLAAVLYDQTIRRMRRTELWLK